MKTSKLTRGFSSLLAVLLILLMLPAACISSHAIGSTTITDYDDLAFLGKGYNLLGSKPLSSNSLVSMSAIFDKSIVNHTTSTRAEGSNTSYTYTYVKDMNSYLKNQSNSLEINMGMSSKIKLFSLEAKAKMGIQESSSSSSDSSIEYAVLKASKKVSASYMDLNSTSKITSLWNNKVVSQDFINAAKAINGEMTIAKFVEMYGTHILTGYATGGEAVVTYSGKTLSTSFSESTKTETEVGASGGLDGLIKLEGNIKSSSESGSSGSSSDSNIDIHGTSYGAGEALAGGFGNGGFNADSVNAFFNSVTYQTSELLIDDSLKLIPIWDLLINSGDSELIEAGNKIKTYFESNIDSQCSEFYNDYLGYQYINDNTTTDVNEWTNYPDAKIITSAEGFYNIRNDLSGVYILASNINLSAYTNWTPIGTQLNPFTGILFGNYNTINGLRITSSTDGYAGLFGYNSGTIKNLRVNGNIAATASTDTFIGSIAAYNRGTISNCYDAVEYDIQYAAISDLNIPVEEMNLSTMPSQTIMIGDSIGIRLAGEEGHIYTGYNIVVSNSGVESPVYIILDNVNIVGNSTNGTIYNETNRPVYIISTGVSNSITGAENAVAVNSADGDVALFGDAALTIIGGNGSDGINATTSGGNGSNGLNGIEGIKSYSLYVNMNTVLTVVGGNGGNGGIGNDGYKGTDRGKGNHKTGGTGGNGGCGGIGGNGASAITTNSINAISSVVVFSGNSGSGGDGGNGGAGGKGGSEYNFFDCSAGSGGAGGLGGNGGNGGDVNIPIICPEINASSNELITYNIGSISNGGNGGHGGAGGSGGWKCTGAGKIYDSVTMKQMSSGTSYTNIYADNGVAGNQIGNIGEANVVSDIDEEVIISGIVCGYTNEKVNKSNQHSWSSIIIDIDFIENVDYFSGARFNRDTVKVVIDSKEIGDYEVVFNSYCSDNIDARIGYMKIIRDGSERFIPIKITRTIPVSIEVAETGKVEFVIGTEFDISGLSVRINYNNGDVEYISEQALGLTYSAPLLSSIKSETVLLSYDYDNNPSTEPLTTSYSVNVVASRATGIEIINTPDQLTYNQGDKLNTYGLVVRKIMNNGTYENLDISQLKFDVNPAFCVVGDSTVTVSYANSYTDTFAVRVNHMDGFEHTWDIGVITTPATHASSGARTYTCTVEHCGATKIEVIQPITGHIYGAWASLDETQHRRVCECGDIDVQSHTWNNGVVITEATHTSKGLIHYVCTGCGAAKDAETDTLAEHSYSEWVNYDNQQHVHTCICEKAEYENHNWDNGVVTLEATYTKTGIMSYTCADCHTTYTEVIPVVESEDAPFIVVDAKQALAGETVSIDVVLKNNPGIASMILKVEYDEAVVTLKNVVYNNEMGGQTVLPEAMISPATLYWVNGFSNSTGDYTFATLTFEVNSNAAADDYSEVNITYNLADVYNIDEQDIEFVTKTGGIVVIDYVPGDINGDGALNNKDVTRLMQYYAGWDVEVNNKAMDVNGDDVLNNKDVTRLMQYLAGWIVEIY